MSESIILHFSGASGAEIFTALAARSERAADRETYCYPSNAAPLLLMSSYPDYDIEYDEEEKARVEGSLGHRPRFSLSIELRRSRQDSACDAAAALVSELSAAHDLVVDDCYRLWTRSEIQREDFMQAYRSKKEPNSERSAAP